MSMVFCFGELLLRMSPELNRKWLQDARMPVYIGGAELNVATALAQWKVPVKYCTALPSNNLSQEICEELEQKQIDISAIQYSGNRIGIYYLPQGTDLKNAAVIYDRAYSSFAELKPRMIDWDKVMQDCNWFHFSAICPALNDNLSMVCREAVEAAAKKEMTISIDLNFRSRLWKYGKKPAEVMPDLVRYCDVIMGNIWSAADLLNIPVDAAIHDKNSRTAYLAHAGETANAIMKLFSKCKAVANTFRFDQGEGIRYYAALDNGTDQFVSPEFSIGSVVDKVGSGDCFMAGLIYGLVNEHAMQQVIDFAAAAAFGKLQERGDATSQSVQSVQNILKNSLKSGTTIN